MYASGGKWANLKAEQCKKVFNTNLCSKMLDAAGIVRTLGPIAEQRVCL